MKKSIFAAVLILPFFVQAQPSWKRTTESVPQTVYLFYATQTANLPTTGTLQQGDFMYEISHRFAALTTGYDGLYGLDGPVTMRTALSYGITDKMMISAGRSNLQDNLDLRFKYKTAAFEYFELPHEIAIQAGLAFNTEVFAGLKKRSAFDTESLQYYGQIIYNTMFMDKKLGFGLVPSLVYNSYIFSDDYQKETKYTFTLPGYLQYYFNRMWSAFVEYAPVISGWKGNIYFDANREFKSHNSLSGGMAIDTGGHSFFLFITNSERLNPSQFLAGASAGVKNRSAWRLAFGITRIL